MIGTKETAAAVVIASLVLSGCAHGSGEVRNSGEHAKGASAHHREKMAAGAHEKEEADEEDEDDEKDEMDEKDEKGEKDEADEKDEGDEEDEGDEKDEMGEEGEEGEEAGAGQMMEAFGDLVDVFQVLGKDLIPASSALEKAMAGRSGHPIEISLETLVREGQAPVVVWQVEVLDGSALKEVSLDPRSGSVLLVADSDESDEAPGYAKALAAAHGSLADGLRDAGKSGHGMVLFGGLADGKGETGWRVVVLQGKDIAIEIMGGGKPAKAAHAGMHKGKEEAEEEDEGDEKDEGMEKK